MRTLWTCTCGNAVRTHVTVTGVWCTRTLACRRGGGRPMIQAVDTPLHDNEENHD